MKTNTSLAKDPVCGMSVDPTAAAAIRVHRERTYFFCSIRCAEKFSLDPENDLAPLPAVPDEPTTVAAADGFTCPMHPEVLRATAGACPKCGMALEPMRVSLSDDSPDHEFDDLRRRFWGSLP